MQNTITNKESALIRNLVGNFPRHPRQVNRLLEADAEIIRLDGKEDEFIVLKTDGIIEEIKTNLYEDPYLIGWMTITAPMSDIAAVGAEPTGILLSLTLPQHYNEQWIQQFKSGIQDACNTYQTYVLGGDTNFDETFSASATAVASLKARHPLLRSGIRAGDFLYTTGPLGLGNGYAYCRFFDNSTNIAYQPIAQLDKGRLISKHANACMDTSDGLFPALSLLSEINNIGFDLITPLEEILHPFILPVQHRSGLPTWMFMAGPHGEYELLFTVPAALQKEFEQSDEAIAVQALFLGKAISEERVCFSSESLEVDCPPAAIPNLFSEANGDIQTYFQLLLRQHEKWNVT